MRSQIEMLVEALANEIDLCVHNQSYGHIQYLIDEIQRLSALQSEQEETHIGMFG